MGVGFVHRTYHGIKKYRYIIMVNTFIIILLLLLIPSWAVTVRRLHDTNRSGWWTLLLFTGIGSLLLLLFVVQEGTEGENDFGDDPKEPYIS